MGCCVSKPSKPHGGKSSATPDQEKHHSADSSTPLASTASAFRSRADTIETSASPPESPIQISDTEGHSNVTRPPPPPRLHRLSELIDPADLDPTGAVRSPSGNYLAAEEFLQHPDRPLSLRERQELIRAKVRAASRLGAVENAQTCEQTEGETMVLQIPSSKKKKTPSLGCFTAHE